MCLILSCFPFCASSFAVHFPQAASIAKCQVRSPDFNVWDALGRHTSQQIAHVNIARAKVMIALVGHPNTLARSCNPTSKQERVKEFIGHCGVMSCWHCCTIPLASDMYEKLSCQWHLRPCNLHDWRDYFWVPCLSTFTAQQNHSLNKFHQARRWCFLGEMGFPYTCRPQRMNIIYSCVLFCLCDYLGMHLVSWINSLWVWLLNIDLLYLHHLDLPNMNGSCLKSDVSKDAKQELAWQNANQEVNCCKLQCGATTKRPKCCKLQSGDKVPQQRGQSATNSILCFKLHVCGRMPHQMATSTKSSKCHKLQVAKCYGLQVAVSHKLHKVSNAPFEGAKCHKLQVVKCHKLQVAKCHMLQVAKCHQEMTINCFMAAGLHGSQVTYDIFATPDSS